MNLLSVLSCQMLLQLDNVPESHEAKCFVFPLDPLNSFFDTFDNMSCNSLFFSLVKPRKQMLLIVCFGRKFRL